MRTTSTALRTLFLIAATLLVSSTALGGTEAFDKQMKPLYTEYARIHQALASDSLAGVPGAAKRIATLATKLDAASVTGEHAAHYQKLPGQIQAAAKTLKSATDLTSAREAFKDLSKPVAMWVTMSHPAGLNVVYCSMSKGSWVQKGATVMNPYYGASMLHCGEIVSGADKKGHDGGMDME